ncbi:hypothetical protein J2046_006786 [Rhizobium petrolearium]|uniref:hypothetical protein n=1 Tax=Neorhizobium petrolearium TaxID=515361 RepID=UPI001AE52501|nr:hypothetical protein [Neorhizobium petrolearium]MBP1848490.1 hypothetical protein [Neorhizobium petrolearium]
MSEKKEAKVIVPPKRDDRRILNDSKKSAHSTQKSFSTAHNKDKIGKPKPGGSG